MQTKTTERMTAQNLILTALKEAYFKRAKKEKIGSSKELTAEIDLLESAIRDLTQKIKDEEN